MEAWRYREHYELEDRHWWFRGRRSVIWGLIARAGVPPSPRVLDAGCGTGRNLVELASIGDVEGVDVSPDAVAYCHRRGLGSVRQSSIHELPFDDERFDLVLATDVIEHLDDPRGALAELRRVAAPGARLVLTVPAYMWLWSRHDVTNHHRRRYTARRLRADAGAAGWRPLVWSYFFSSALPAVAVVRTVQRLKPHRNGGSDLAVAPRGLNRALELPLRAEAELIKRGIRLPAGVSVGMVCTPR